MELGTDLSNHGNAVLSPQHSVVHTKSISEKDTDAFGLCPPA